MGGDNQSGLQKSVVTTGKHARVLCVPHVLIVYEGQTIRKWGELCMSPAVKLLFPKNFKTKKQI